MTPELNHSAIAVSMPETVCSSLQTRVRVRRQRFCNCEIALPIQSAATLPDGYEHSNAERGSQRFHDTPHPDLD